MLRILGGMESQNYLLGRTQIEARHWDQWERKPDVTKWVARTFTPTITLATVVKVTK